MATELYNRLCEEELRVFPEVAEMPKKEKIPEIEEAIRTTSVHIAIFSPGYAESRVCLMELVLMLKIGATIIRVFYDVKPSELRSAEDNGLYAEALGWMENTESVNSELTEKWRVALSEVSYENGFELESHNSTDARQLAVNAILKEVVRNIGHVFINRCSDVQKTFASHLHRRLRFCGQRVFVDKEEEELREEDEGYSLTRQIKDAIGEASLHIAIFSENYVESSCCLNELVSMVESKATIIPVFYGVEPSVLRYQKTNNTNENWKKTLFEVTEIVGFRKAGYSDDGLLVNNIVERVLIEGEAPSSHDVFINHRGPDTKETLASHLYRRLLALGLKPFIDKEDLQTGHEITPQLKCAIKNASVNIAIFSTGYADSTWCMKELDLMLGSEADIIPVYYGVEASDLRETSKDSERVYARALSNLERKRRIDSSTNQSTQRYDSSTIDNWRQVLSKFADIRGGFDLKDHDGDEGLVLDKIVPKVHSIVRIKKDKQRSNSDCYRQRS